MVSAFHIRGWSACEGARLVALADPDIARARARAGEAGVPAFPSLVEMAATMHLDAVDIASPVTTHVQLVEEAVAARLHVICQKPLAPTVAIAEALVSRLPQESRVMVHENWRWRPPYRALARALRTGELAAPDHFSLDVASSGLLPDASGIRPALARQPFLAQMPRLTVLELLIHHLDTLAFLFGPVVIRAAVLERRSGAVRGEDYARIGLTAGSVEGTLVGDFCRPGASPFPHDHLVVNGSASAVVDGLGLTVGGRSVCLDDLAGYQASYTATIQHFVDQLATGKPFETPPEVALETLRAVDCVYNAASNDVAA